MRPDEDGLVVEKTESTTPWLDAADDFLVAAYGKEPDSKAGPAPDPALLAQAVRYQPYMVDYTPEPTCLDPERYVVRFGVCPAGAKIADEAVASSGWLVLTVVQKDGAWTIGSIEYRPEHK